MMATIVIIGIIAIIGSIAEREPQLEKAYLSMIFDVAPSASAARATKKSEQAKTSKLLAL